MARVLRFLGLSLFATALLLGSTAQDTNAQARRAPATIIQVFPGTNKALRKALRQAQPGDILNIHAGTYKEVINVNKHNLTLQSAGDGEVIIDAQCSAVAALTMNAEGIIVKGLTVRGGTFFAINLEHRASGEIRNNTVDSACPGAEYGVNVFDGGSIKIIGNKGSGWQDAVVYVGGINATPNGALVVKRNETYNSVRGIIIEDSFNVNIRVVRNKARDNTETGILIHNSDGVVIQGNIVTNNTTNGIHLDSTSDTNVVTNNTFTGHTFDINNEGSGNCFSSNTFTTSSGPTTPTCP